MNESVQLLIGPARSGKTRAAVERAFNLAVTGERVLVLTLPQQRSAFIGQLASLGPTLGVEVTNLQNVAYRLLDRLGENRSVVLNPGRIALTARALESVLDRAVNPGEARLYARAIAECKRYFVIPQCTGELYQDVLTNVFSCYQKFLEAGALQDLDDVRLRLIHFLQQRFLVGTPLVLGAHLIVDGYRAFNPSELEAIRALSDVAQSSFVTLPAGAPDTAQDAWAHVLRPAEVHAIAQRLNAQPKRLQAPGKPWSGLADNVAVKVFTNPVEETRAVLRAIKRFLLEGVAAFEICVMINNPASTRVLEALGREYGVPIAPETQGTLLDSPEGRVLEALLGAPSRDYASRDLRALAVLEPTLARLADALESAGVHSGSLAYSLVSNDLDALAALKRIRALAEPPRMATVAELVIWFEQLLARVLYGAHFLDAARVVAREASRILDAGSNTVLDGITFTEWLRALLANVPLVHPMAGRGVAVLSPSEASGRRFRHAFVMGVVDGAYRTGDGEDFFVPEQDRAALEIILSGITGLATRLVGLEDSGLYDVLTRADESITITYARAERGTSLRPHARLASLAQNLVPVQAVPTASAFELLAATTQRETRAFKTNWQVRPKSADRAIVLERATECNVRAWAETNVPFPTRGTGIVTSELLRSWQAKLRRGRWRGDDITPLEAAPIEHAERIHALAPNFRAALEHGLNARVPAPQSNDIQLGYKVHLDGLEITLDGVRFRKNRDGAVVAVEIYRVLEDAADGYEKFMQPDRQREWWFAAWWQSRGIGVHFFAWDLSSTPRRVFGLDKPYAQKRLREAIAALELAKANAVSGMMTATPGFHCRQCAYRDVCREAV